MWIHRKITRMYNGHLSSIWLEQNFIIWALIFMCPGTPSFIYLIISWVSVWDKGARRIEYLFKSPKYLSVDNLIILENVLGIKPRADHLGVDNGAYFRTCYQTISEIASINAALCGTKIQSFVSVLHLLWVGLTWNTREWSELSLTKHRGMTIQ